MIDLETYQRLQRENNRLKAALEQIIRGIAGRDQGGNPKSDLTVLDWVNNIAHGTLNVTNTFDEAAEQARLGYIPVAGQQEDGPDHPDGPWADGWFFRTLTDERVAQIIDAVEDYVGMGHGAWDMVRARELVEGFARALHPERAAAQEDANGE